MSSSKKRARTSDRVFLNVGGEVFQTTISTLTANSEFFSRKFSSEWSSDAEDEIFLDRDADSFRVLLSCMRHRTALLPDGDPLLCTRVLLEYATEGSNPTQAGLLLTRVSLALDRAQYLGVDWLLEHVKGVAYTHTLDPADGVVETEVPHVAFDRDHGSLDQALRSGVLPARFFGPVKTGSKRVKQIIPAKEHDAIMFDSNADDVYRAVCYALFENERGESVIEPVVSCDRSDEDRSSLFCLASEKPGHDTWTMSEQGARFEYDVTAVRDISNGSVTNTLCEEGFYVKTVLPGAGGEFVLMEKQVTGYV